MPTDSSYSKYMYNYVDACLCDGTTVTFMVVTSTCTDVTAVVTGEKILFVIKPLYQFIDL